MSERTVHIAQPSMGDDEWNAIRETIHSGWVTQGPKVAEFEKLFAERHGVKHALAVTSCTTGLHLILDSLGIGPGDEVIVPSFTWVATANVVCYCGATPVLCDVDPRTCNIDPADAAAKRTDRTKAVIPVHLFGLCADVDAVAEALPGVTIVEDAACAAGAACKGRSAGSLATAGAFSFHPRKSITTGEGGMVTTNDDALAEMMNRKRNHGASLSEEQRHAGPRPYLLPAFDVLGYNYRMTDIQACVGLVQFDKLDAFIARRDEMAGRYAVELGDLDWLDTPFIPEGWSPAWQAYVCTVDPAKAPRPRNDIMEALKERGIATRPGTHAVHMLGYYRETFGYAVDDLPGARDCDRNTMAIPLHNRMSDDDQSYVIEALHQIG